MRRFVSGPGGNAPPPIDGLVQLLNDVYQWLVAAKAGPRMRASHRRRPTRPTSCEAEAARQPEPFARCSRSIGGRRDAGDRPEKTRERIDAELRTQVADFCVKATGGRYPFVRASAQDVTPEDFAQLFAQGGLLDGFFQKYLARTSTRARSPGASRIRPWGSRRHWPSSSARR